jgi:hypothetical protein
VSGIAQIDLFENVHVAEPLPVALYSAVKVLLPEERVTTNDALACCKLLPPRITARASVAASVVAPLTLNDMKHELPPPLPSMPDVTETSALVVPAGSITVVVGPGLGGAKTVL